MPVEEETKGIIELRHYKQNFRHTYTQTPLTLSEYKRLLYGFHLPCELCPRSEYTVKEKVFFS